jgi:hypothetical protein
MQASPALARASIVLSVLLVLLITAGSIIAQDEIPDLTPDDDEPYTAYAFFSSVTVPTEIVTGSDELNDSPGGTRVYLSSIRGLPANAFNLFIGAFDLIGGRTYELSVETLTALELECEDLAVYKVNRDATSGRFPNASCDSDGNLRIRNSDGNGTFILLLAGGG